MPTMHDQGEDTQLQSAFEMEAMAKRKSSAPMRTYSKRARGNNQTSSMKRQRVDSLDFNPISPSIPSDSSAEVCQDQVLSDHGKLSHTITPPSHEYLQENLSASLVPKLRVPPAKTSRSVPPLGTIRSAEENQRVGSVGGEDQSECSTGKSSSRIKGIKAISGGRLTKALPRSKSAPQSRRNTTKDSSFEHEPETLSAGRALDSTTISLNSDIEKENIPTSGTGSDDHSSDYSPEVKPTVPKPSFTGKAFKKSSIRNYFQALPPPSSSPSASRSVIFSDEVPQRTPSPPSSPPSLSNIRPSIDSKLQKVRRRLSTKPQLPSIYKRDASTDVKECLDVNDIAGSLNHPTEIPVMEHFLDREDRRSPTSKHAEQNQGMSRSNASSMVVDSEFRGSDPSSSDSCNDYAHIARSDISQHDQMRPENYRSTRHQYPSSSNPNSAVLESPPPRHTPINIPGAEERKLKPKPPPSKGLVQQLLDLGQTPHTECKECGMHFTMAIPSERRTHDAYHKLFSKGCLKKMNMTSILISEKVDVDTSHKIFMVDYKSALKFRDLAESILENSLADMDGAIPGPRQLWSMVQDGDEEGMCVPRFKFFFYTVAETPVGILLAERVGSARPYERVKSGFGEEDRGAEGASASAEEVEVYMAVDRIWVHKDWRMKGIARHLVDVAREKFIGGMVVEKDKVAVSHPTAAGRVFARKYFEGVFGEVAEFLVC